jgi:hypothetical protein
MWSSNTSKPRHLLAIFVKEPVQGKVKPTLSNDTSPYEAYLSYKTLVTAIFHQLEGLQDTQVVCYISPEDAIDAVKFWLLPLLRGNVTMIDETRFHLTPSKAAPSMPIHFRAAPAPPNEDLFQKIRHHAFADGYKTVSITGTNCPDCGARWIHMAQLFALSQQARVIGECKNHGLYLSTEPQQPIATKTLPHLPKIKTKTDWDSILDSPIGGKLMRIYNELKSNDL